MYKVNESYLQQVMFSAFNRLNAVSGIEYLTEMDESGRYVGNVAYPNETFDPPESNFWFELNLIVGEPESIGLFKESQNRWTGILQIDLHTPLDTGTAQIDAVYYWLNEMFKKGSEYAECSINGITKTPIGAEENNYKTVFRVEFDADID